MAEVTVYTAARMLQIENDSIVSGFVDGNGDLILVQKDGTQINAGEVKSTIVGPQGPGATLANTPPPSPQVGAIFVDKNGLTGVTDLMAAKNPATSTANWLAYAFGYDTGVTFSVAGGGVTLTWTTTGNHFAGIPLTGLSQGEQYLAMARVRVPAGSPDVKLTVGYRTSSQPVTMKDVDVTVMLQFTADNTGLSWGIECGGATGSCIVKELKVYAVNQKGFPQYYWDGTSWVQMEHMAAKADIYSRVNTYGDQTVAGLKTFTSNIKTNAFIAEIGADGTTADSAEVHLRGADAGAGGGGGAVQWFKNAVSKWKLYTLGSGDGNLYVRDMANSKMVATFKPGGANASVFEVTDTLIADFARIARAIDISGTDLNTLTNMGVFNGSSLTNAPNGDAGWWYIEQLVHVTLSPGYAVQRATQLATGEPQVWQRSKIAGTWGVWRPLGGTTAWTAVTFQNSWANYGGSFQTAQYRRVGDIVELRGLVRNGTAGTTMFTLPAGFRPPALQLFGGIHDIGVNWATGAASAGTAHTHSQTRPASAAYRIDVSSTGTVDHYSTHGTGYVDLSMIRFSTSA